jgi:DnaJ-domain-containing protein 1
VSDEKRIKELENSLSIALENVDNYQRENKKLTDENDELKKELARAKEDHQYDNLVHENELKSMKSKKHRMNQK